MTPADTDDVTTFLRAAIARRTLAPAEQIVERTVLIDIGLQSLDAVMICGEVEDRYQIEVEPSLMFEYRTFGEVVEAVAALLRT
jgi:acyl carrier protein